MEEEMFQRLRKFLEILGNSTRCRILDLVADQPRFISEISRELDIGQQAILRHLDELENFGLLTSFEEEDVERKRKGRKRKYYEISPTAQYRMFISIDKDDLIFDFRTPETPKHFDRLGKIEEQIEDVKQLRGFSKYERIQELIHQIEEEIYHLDEARKFALRLLEKLKSEFE
ncbi:MAG: ArsR/SmtB family transcription factor [Candidatus Helarchaeota archaeon]